MQLLPPSLLLLTCAALGGSTAAQGKLWVVDQAGGPGADFTEIQPAVDAAADGDTVMVRSGTYASFTIFAKELVVTRENTGFFAPNVYEIRVQGLTADQEVAVRGLTIRGGCMLDQNDGPVWLESLVLEPSPLGCDAGILFLASGLRVQACSAVIVTRCTFASAGGSGIDASDSSLYLFDTAAFGGENFSGGSGLAGVKVTDSFLFASGSMFQGGCGGDGGECIAGDKGGYGLVSSGGSPPQLLQTVLAGGPGGCGLGCGGCGPPGGEASGSYELVAGFPRASVLASPAAAGQTTTLDYHGKAGDIVFSLIGLAPSALYLPELAGPLVLPIPPLLISHGLADGFGNLHAVVALPLLPPGIEAFTVYAQAAAISPVGAAVLGAPSQLSIL